LFRLVLDARVRSAELSTYRHLVVCKLHLETPPGHLQTCRCRTRRSSWIKWEVLVETKDVRKAIASRASSLFGEFPECTANCFSGMRTEETRCGE